MRTLKIESDGDFSARKVVPKIRLRGKWLQSLGFTPEARVTDADADELTTPTRYD